MHHSIWQTFSGASGSCAPLGTYSRRPQKLCTTWHIFAEASVVHHLEPGVMHHLAHIHWSLLSPNILREACETFPTDGTCHILAQLRLVTVLYYVPLVGFCDIISMYYLHLDIINPHVGGVFLFMGVFLQCGSPLAKIMWAPMISVICIIGLLDYGLRQLQIVYRQNRFVIVLITSKLVHVEQCLLFIVYPLNMTNGM